MQLPRFFARLESRLSPKHLIFLWYRHYKLAYFVTFLLVLGYGGWQWRQSLYSYQWSAEEKKAYLDSYFKETTFQKEKFEAVVEAMKKRAENHSATPEPVREIFVPRPPEEKP